MSSCEDCTTIFIFLCAWMCVLLPIIIGGSLFGVGSRTCPNVWASQSRYTIPMVSQINETMNIDISDIAFSSTMRVHLSNVKYTFLEMQPADEYFIEFSQGYLSLARFDSGSLMTQTFKLLDKKTLTVKSNRKMQFELTPIRQKCVQTTAGAIILILIALGGAPLAGGGTAAAANRA